MTMSAEFLRYKYHFALYYMSVSYLYSHLYMNTCYFKNKIRRNYEYLQQSSCQHGNTL